ncbi:hypothetical protein RRG08_061066 [Elysia crispata]|uniref:Uncharacterized protein n=1 Tax=Elysia crispata TaxID=231223 RepID=A0AAE0ZTB9_9GAST|nr:hypothetical protein RRG08_061066 [Elysia crispata]
MPHLRTPAFTIAADMQSDDHNSFKTSMGKNSFAVVVPKFCLANLMRIIPHAVLTGPQSPRSRGYRTFVELKAMLKGSPDSPLPSDKDDSSCVVHEIKY